MLSPGEKELFLVYSEGTGLPEKSLYQLVSFLVAMIKSVTKAT